MTTLNMPLDIAKDLLRTSEEYAELNPTLAEDMARRAFEIGREFDVAEQLERLPTSKVGEQEKSVETLPHPESCKTEDARALEDDLDDDDQDALLSLLSLQRNVLSESPDRAPPLRRRPKAHLSLVSPTE